MVTLTCLPHILFQAPTYCAPALPYTSQILPRTRPISPRYSPDSLLILVSKRLRLSGNRSGCPSDTNSVWSLNSQTLESKRATSSSQPRGSPAPLAFQAFLAEMLSVLCGPPRRPRLGTVSGRLAATSDVNADYPCRNHLMYGARHDVLSEFVPQCQAIILAPEISQSSYIFQKHIRPFIAPVAFRFDASAIYTDNMPSKASPLGFQERPLTSPDSKVVVVPPSGSW